MTTQEREVLNQLYRELAAASFELPLLGEGYIAGPRVPEMKERFRLALHRLHVFVAQAQPSKDAPRPRTVTEERWGWWHAATQDLAVAESGMDEPTAMASRADGELLVRVTLTYTVPGADGDEMAHNCDAMGCRQEHVIAVVPLAPGDTPSYRTVSNAD